MANLITSMTEVFTRAAACATAWTYEAEGGNNVPGGLILQNAYTYTSSCWPPGFNHIGRVRWKRTYSPGWCPVGYTSDSVALNNDVTTAICCLSGFKYYSETQSYGNSGYDVYAGCTSMLPEGNTTTIPVRQETTVTEVNGPITMWAQPLIVALEASDSSLFVTPSTSSTPAVPRETSTIPSPTATETDSAPDTQRTTNTSSGGGLSTGAGIGIGVGVGVGGFAVFAAVGLWIWRSRKAKKEAASVVAQRPTYNDQGGPYYYQTTPLYRVPELNEVPDTSTRQETGIPELHG
ncbi:hypothetical protein BDV18DRAFT_161248 [Aspergillus unguis]